MWVTSLYHMIRCVSQSINQTTEVVHTRTLIILFLFYAIYAYPIMDAFIEYVQKEISECED